VDVISKERYKEFEQHWIMEFMRNPHYRLGQAFLNYFPEIGKIYLNDGDHGHNEEHRLWNTRDLKEANSIIQKWINE
jgi:hypothetical protein